MDVSLEISKESPCRHRARDHRATGGILCKIALNSPGWDCTRGQTPSGFLAPRYFHGTYQYMKDRGALDSLPAGSTPPGATCHTHRCAFDPLPQTEPPRAGLQQPDEIRTWRKGSRPNLQARVVVADSQSGIIRLIQHWASFSQAGRGVRERA